MEDDASAEPCLKSWTRAPPPAASQSHQGGILDRLSI